MPVGSLQSPRECVFAGHCGSPRVPSILPTWPPATRVHRPPHLPSPQSPGAAMRGAVGAPEEQPRHRCPRLEGGGGVGQGVLASCWGGRLDPHWVQGSFRCREPHPRTPAICAHLRGSCPVPDGTGLHPPPPPHPGPMEPQAGGSRAWGKLIPPEIKEHGDLSLCAIWRFCGLSALPPHPSPALFLPQGRVSRRG